MHPSIFSVLARLRQDVAEILTPRTIRDACRRTGYSWRNRTLDPVATTSLFLLQILHGNTACRHVVQLGQWAFSATAYCKARKRLPLAVLQTLVEMVAAKLRSTTAGGADWLGHRVWMIDGSGFSMPDAPELQSHFGSPAGQRPGCGFPVGHLVALFDLATGMLLRVTTSPMRTHDMSQVAYLAWELKPGDLRGQFREPFRGHPIRLLLPFGPGHHLVKFTVRPDPDRVRHAPRIRRATKPRRQGTARREVNDLLLMQAKDRVIPAFQEDREMGI